MVGYLHPSSPEPHAYQVDAFKKGLSETGYVEGVNVASDFVWAHNGFDRLSALASGLVSRRVNVIVAIAGVAALAAKAAMSSIPIVFNSSVNPVQIGLVATLNRPGGNLTGVTDMHVELGPKRLTRSFRAPHALRHSRGERIPLDLSYMTGCF
jgi:putative ABC transport system substrate-binding protein